MKKLFSGILAIAMIVMWVPAQAATRVKTNENALALNVAGAWDTVPGASDIASWTAVETTANTAALGADTTWQGIQIVGPGGLVTISAGNTLTLGAAATDIDMTAATQNLTINAGLSLGAANVWDVVIGKTLTVGGNVANGANLLTVQGAGNTTISGILGNGAGGLTKAGTGTLTLGGVNTYTGATTIGAGGTLALNATGTIATSSGVANAGTLTIAADKTIDSMTGAGATTLGGNTLTIGDASNTSGTYTGTFAADAGKLTTAGTGTLTLGGVASYTGLTTIGAGSTLVLNTTGTIATSSGVSNAGTFTIQGNKTIGTMTGTGAASIINLGANTLTEGALVLPASATVNLTANSGTSYGNAAITGTITNNAATTFGVTVGGYIPNGATLNVLNASAGAPTAVTTTPTSTSPNVSFATSVSGNDIILTATRVTTAAATGNNTAVATTINGAGTPTGDFSTVLGQLDSLTSSSAIDAAYAQMDPVVNAGVNASSFNQVNLSIDALSQHLSETASGGSKPAPKSGVATGDEFKNGAIWAKGIGTHADQGTRSGIAGYTANLWGVTGGVDGEIADSLRLGLGGGYAATSVDNKGSDGGGTDLGSVQGTIYLNYDDPSPWYGTAGFSFNWNMYEGSRNIAFGTINRTAKSSYDGQQYTGFSEIGYVFKNMDIEQNQEWDITPLAGLTYSHLALDSYTETEAGDLNLNVRSQDYDLLQSSVGLKVERPWTTSDGKWVPEVHGKWLYDFIGDKAATTATFTGGGSSFSTNGADPAQSSFDMGAGLTFYSKGNISITGTYDFEIKSDYTSHTGQGVIRYTF